MNSAVRPGQRLRERDLTERFGVSSIPVREALRELEGRGLVVKRHNCGCSVIELTRPEAAGILELRRLLETEMVRWAAARATGEELAALEERVVRLEAAARKGEAGAFFEEDLNFHRAVWMASGNRYAARALEAALGSLFAAGLSGPRGGDIDLIREATKHRRLLAALRARDPQRAAAALLEIAADFEKHLPAGGNGNGKAG